jgi:hypothetical protein
MPMGILFWVVYILSLLVGGWAYYTPATPWLRPAGGFFAIWLLVGLLGWQVFGPAVR